MNMIVTDKTNIKAK